MYESQIEAFRAHLMWTVTPVYEYGPDGKAIRVIDRNYQCCGCGFEATTEQERHEHIVSKIEDSHLRDTMTRTNWLDLPART